MQISFARSLASNNLGETVRPCVGDLVRVITTKDERCGLTGKIVEDDGSDQPFLLEFDGAPSRKDGNDDWFGSGEVEKMGGQESGIQLLAAVLSTTKITNLKYDAHQTCQHNCV